VLKLRSFNPAPVDGEQGVVLPAVDVDRDELSGEFGEGPADGGGLPGPRRPAENGVPRAGALEEEGKFLASRWWRWSGM